jgi:hypothetical protein
MVVLLVMGVLIVDQWLIWSVNWFILGWWLSLIISESRELILRWSLSILSVGNWFNSI